MVNVAMNVLNEEQLKKLEVLKSLASYYQLFEKFLKDIEFLKI